MSEPANEWSPPDPSTLPGLRAELAEHMRSPVERDQTAQMLLDGLGTVSPRTGNPAQDAAVVLAEEHDRLTAAELYYVTEDMTRLATVAAASLPVHSFRAEDVPAEAGFMLFSEPVGVYTPTKVPNMQDVLVRIVAVSWGPSRMLQGAGVWMTFWSVTDIEGTARTLQRDGRMSYSKAYEFVRQNKATLAWDNELVLHYGASQLGIVSEDSSYSQLRGTSEPIDPEQGWEQVRGTNDGVGSDHSSCMAVDYPAGRDRCGRPRPVAGCATSLRTSGLQSLPGPSRSHPRPGKRSRTQQRSQWAHLSRALDSARALAKPVVPEPR